MLDNDGLGRSLTSDWLTGRSEEPALPAAPAEGAPVPTAPTTGVLGTVGGPAAARRRPAPFRRSARLLATSEAPRQARHFVAAAVAEWQADPALVDDVVLVVSELVSDAARYPLAVAVEITLAARAGRLELVVADSCPQPPLCADEQAGGGWLARSVLETCSEAWEWSTTPQDGRIVRAYFLPR
ncbi:hypothetical protein EV189_2225 [Motilibacter rhizosphaerae]|uniref:Histidine kinase/HSP90-like ATPase domain-containing protein n=1 Tax=Motilibacter rhizosphaerae TaxID=598652 RepID=A0A4Q7NNK0_9ACTN|nr:ATP-binding protein [Motilibacter rhizosphaerae]RZS86809.1 hypothetical protein EV189_2225 [Motilibacter rhizosphaerae]